MRQNINMRMTLEEISEVYGYSKNSIQTNFRRTAQAFRKKYGLELIKCNSYDGVFYEVSPLRALTMYEEIKEDLYVPIETIKLDDLISYVLIGIAATPQGVFRGTRKDFLDYLGLSHSKKNIELLNQALKDCVNQQGSQLVVQQDKDIIILYIKRDFEQKLIIPINILRQCREIVEKYNKQSMKVIQVLKVWQAYRINIQKGVNPLTDKDLQKYIDLSEKQIRDAKKMLQSENIVKIQRAGSYYQCEGSDITLNRINDDKMLVIKD